MIARDHDPHGSLRQLTKRLAELLASDTGTLALAELQQIALLSGPRADPAPRETGLRVGIWTPEIGPGGAVEFVRNPAFAHEWRYWADVDRIRSKNGPRVVLLGESVARGYLFDPLITPAAMLSTLLGGADVVDLARTDLGIDGLRSMFDALPALEPDAIVVFAGNNWHSLVFELPELQRLATGLREDGYPGCRRVFLDILAARARSLLAALAGSAAEFSIPVVIVVPEFNLVDWRTESALGAPVLSADGNVRWLRLRDAAQKALANGNDEQAARLALELHELDGGTSSVGPSILARARPAERRQWLERARDAIVGILVAHSPRCPAVVQDVLREESTRHGFHLVDLPRVFDTNATARPERGREAPESKGLANRELFVDYCHLTPRGMRMAMAAVAAVVAPLARVRARMDAAIDVRPEDEATGFFLAAIHNAHYGQSDEILRDLCSKAATLSPRAREQMAWYVECATGWSEMWTSAAFRRLCESPIVRRYLLAPEVRSQKLADFRLTDAMMSALEDAGDRIRPAIISRLKAEHGTCDEIDLLDPRYRAFTFRDRGGYALSAERAYVRATELTSRFALIRAEAGLVRLEVTCRTPAGGDVVISLNGERAGAVRASTRWHTTCVTLHAQEGVNWLELRWPPAAPPSNELERAAQRLERGLYPDVLPCYGEIHALTATAA